jgi:cytochrome c-type biogenesis protein CcsB
MKFQPIQILRKLGEVLFSVRASGMYLLILAAVIGIATFIENDFGTSSAQKIIYKARWFELLLLLLSGSIAANIVRYRMIQQRKWGLFIFHASVIIIVAGAAITRYTGFEGVMHIREGATSSSFNSAEPYLKFQVDLNDRQYNFEEPIQFAALGDNSWDEFYQIGDELLNIRVKEIIPNPVEVLDATAVGDPVLKVVLAGSSGREEYLIKPGELRQLGNVIFNFTGVERPDAVNLTLVNDNVFIKPFRTLTSMTMATRQTDTLVANGSQYPLTLRALYTDGINQFVFPEFTAQGNVRLESSDPKIKNDSRIALLLEVEKEGAIQQEYLFSSRGASGEPKRFVFGNMALTASYGSKQVELPFKLRLNEFILERYPGTQSASSYASEVTLIDPANGKQEGFRIYMNHILNYGGYRFFQSSYDRDELGTYLSVNHDFWGTWVSYLGYALLALGMILTLFSKNSRFYQLSQKLKKLRTGAASLVLLASFLNVSNGYTQSTPAGALARNTVSLEHADIFSHIVVQDFKGRMKPIHTLTREVMRKVTRKESLYGLSADQIFLGMFASPDAWYGAPIVKVGEHKDLQRLLGINESVATYRDFFERDGSYKLRDVVRKAFELEPGSRSIFEKDLLKLDERVNILNMVFSGSLLRIFPIPDDGNQTWVSNQNHNHGPNETPRHEIFISGFFKNYRNALKAGITNGNFTEANSLLADLKEYQQINGSVIMPSDTQLNAEILLNKLNVFNRLAAGYMLLGVAFLLLLFVGVFKPKWQSKKVFWALSALLIAGFAFHTLGLGLRWYVSERAPWSNGYESMIYIGWTTMLAGLLFSRKSLGGLAATSVLGGTILLVSTLSFLDPEITPLVPVLKSYWLTIHVSLEAGSYGFLMLGALMGIINLILMILVIEGNQKRIQSLVRELSYLSETTLIAGLFMVSIGTFLGGIWANESWGRYWGWDAKETWALVTILVYAFILHMRLIPKMKGLYAYNLATVFGLASVIMTYYGVNYYLSGLHSYATGDPVPIPNWVYIAVAVIILMASLAFLKKRKFPIVDR